MMGFADLVESQNLQIFRYRDIDHFRQGFRRASVDIVPLANAAGPLGQAVLSLPGCDIYLLRTFPRIVHAMLESNPQDHPAILRCSTAIKPASDGTVICQT